VSDAAHARTTRAPPFLDPSGNSRHRPEATLLYQLVEQHYPAFREPASGHVRYTLKTPYRDGTTHLVLEPLDLMARLAALVPPPRMHLTRFHGVVAPHSQLRAAVTPAHRGRGAAKWSPTDPAKPATPRHVAMSWARRLKRVFGIEIDSCARCGGRLAILASIEEPEIIAKILSHLERTAPERYQTEQACRRQARAHHKAGSANKTGHGRPVEIPIR
jgi:hypothetical protein